MNEPKYIRKLVIFTGDLHDPYYDYLTNKNIAIKDGMRGLACFFKDNPDRVRVKFFVYNKFCSVKREHLTIIGDVGKSAIFSRTLRELLYRINEEDTAIVNSYENACRCSEETESIQDLYWAGTSLDVLFEAMGDQGNGASRYIQTITYKGEKLLCAR